MAQREGGAPGGGGSNRAKKNRTTPYKLGRGGGGAMWRTQQDQQKTDSLLPMPVPKQELGQGPLSGQSLTDSGAQTPPQIKKFTNKARLFFGNLPRDFTEDELKKMLEAHGEVQEIYHNREKNFAFARMAYKSEAEQVIQHHNGQTIRNRDIKVKFAASSASIKVSNINPYVSNELLAEAFSRFGEVEEAIVATDDRGKPLGYGVVDFTRKGQAMSALQKCAQEPFLLTKSPVPVVVTEMIRDNEEGLPERELAKNSAYHFEREAPPRFPQPGSLEFDVAQRWKAFLQQERVERDKLEDKIKEMKSVIQNDMDTIKEQHQTLVLRQEIARHQQEQQRLAERLREQEERLKGLNAAQTSMGLLPSINSPAPLFPPIMGDNPRPNEGMMPGDMGPLMPPPHPHHHGHMPGGPLFMGQPPPPLMGQKPR